MKTTQQKVETYYNMKDAKEDMSFHIYHGWRIHTCTANREQVLVVYEKKFLLWN